MSPRTERHAGRTADGSNAGGIPRDRSVLRGRKLLFLVTEDWYFCSHRLPIARAARDAGMDVLVATRIGKHRDNITAEGFRIVSLPWRRRSRDLLAEARTFVKLLRLYRRERPDVVHHVALKPALYGSLAAALTGTRRQINALAGFGYVFTAPSFRARLLRPIFRGAFKYLMNTNGARLIVQNADDRNALIDTKTFDRRRIALIRGSGVDVQRFRSARNPAERPTVTLVSRMLWTKGVGETVEAAQLLKARGVDVTVLLAGDPDPENPASIPRATLGEWHDGGLVEWLGHVDDVVPVWSKTQVAVLPSYREGLPKALLEAASCGLPAVAADVPGCREIVRHGESGLLVPAKDAHALADAIEQLLVDKTLRERMGRRAREIVVEEFSEHKVVEQTLTLYDSMLKMTVENK